MTPRRQARSLEWLRLRGFPGGSARAGNWVRGQFQLDALGETLSLFAAAARHDMLAKDDWRAAAVATGAIEKRWPEPDAGLWELDNRHWTHSRLACVTGLRAIAAAATEGPPGGPGHREAARWSALADGILASLGDAVHPSGRGQRAPDDDRVDAALLLPVIRNALPLEDPRSQATIEAVRKELGADGYVHRFRHDPRPLHKAEGAFLLCGFWMALVEHLRGNPAAAAHWFERSRGSAGRRRCTPRSTTCISGNCGATCRRHSCTRACSSARSAVPPTSGSEQRPCDPPRELRYMSAS